MGSTTRPDPSGPRVRDIKVVKRFLHTVEELQNPPYKKTRDQIARAMGYRGDYPSTSLSAALRRASAGIDAGDAKGPTREKLAALFRYHSEVRHAFDLRHGVEEHNRMRQEAQIQEEVRQLEEEIHTNGRKQGADERGSRLGLSLEERHRRRKDVDLVHHVSQTSIRLQHVLDEKLWPAAIELDQLGSNGNPPFLNSALREALGHIESAIAIFEDGVRAREGAPTT